MKDVIKWSGHGGISFFVKPNEIRGFKDLNITVASETKDSKQAKEKFVELKNKGSYVIQLTAVLNAALMDDVKDAATAITESARNGESGYLYMGDSKLFPSLFMSTEAKISSISPMESGEWSYCEVTWTLKQCSQYNGKKKKKKKKDNKDDTTDDDLNVIDDTAVKVTVEGLVIEEEDVVAKAKRESAAILADARKRQTGNTSAVSGKINRTNMVK